MTGRARGAHRAALLLALLCTLVGGVGPAGAQDEPTTLDDGTDEVGGAGAIEPRFAAPVVVVNRTTFEPGDEIVLTIAGFRSRSVTAFVCGNEARRGSGDCDNIGSKTAELRADGESTVIDMTVSAPPLPCPCLVRVASPDGDEVAVARVTLIGHPTAPVVGGDLALAEPLAIGVGAQRASTGFVNGLFAALGASTSYDVTVTVRNAGTTDVDGVAVDAWAGRGDRVLESFVVELPDTLAAGETVEDVVRVELPAPHYGTAEWHVEAAVPNAPTVADTASTSNLPWLLFTLLAVLVVDLVVLLARLVARLRRRRVEGGVAGDEEAVIDLTGTEPRVTAGV